MSNDLSELFGARPKKSTMEKIPQPSQKDVLCGRGGGTLRHIGNRKYRSLIKLNKPVYLISTKEQKSAISRSIVDVIRNNGGRFLEKATNRNWYHDIGDAKAMEKTSQALREGQSKLRKRLIHSAMNLDNTSSDHNININIRTAGAFDAMFMSPPALADSPTRNHVNAMMHPPSALRRSLDSLIASESELLRRELPPRPYYSRSSSNNNNNNNNNSHPRRADIIINNNNNNNRSPPRSRNVLFGPRVGQMDPTHAHRLGSVMVTPPFSPKRTVQPSERLVDMFPRPTLYGDPDRGQTRQEHETPIIDFLNDANADANAADDDANDYDYDNDANDYDNNANNANDDDNNANNANNDDDNDDANDEDDSIMTFDLDDEELDDEELFRDNDDSEEMMMTSSVPTWPVTNHPTALNNLNTNENLSAVSLDSYSVQRQEQQHRRRQQQQQQQQFRHRESDGNTELHVRRKYSSQDEVEFTDHENEDSGYISLGMLAPMFRKEANYHSIRLAI